MDDVHGKEYPRLGDDGGNKGNAKIVSVSMWIHLQTRSIFSFPEPAHRITPRHITRMYRTFTQRHFEQPH